MAFEEDPRYPSTLEKISDVVRDLITVAVIQNTPTKVLAEEFGRTMAHLAYNAIDEIDLEDE